jgi:CHAD domain-containing protein
MRKLHKAREARKRARYAAGLPSRCGGRKSRNAVRRYQDRQGILGDHHDGVVAADLLRRSTVGSSRLLGGFATRSSPPPAPLRAAGRM